MAKFPIPFLNKISRSKIVRQEFKYSKDKVELNFALRTDTKEELEDFLDLLNMAVEDVSAELEKHN